MKASKVGHELECCVCREFFTPAQHRKYSQKYCSQKCRNKANYLESIYRYPVNSPERYEAVVDLREWLSDVNFYIEASWREKGMNKFSFMKGLQPDFGPERDVITTNLNWLYQMSEIRLKNQFDWSKSDRTLRYCYIRLVMYFGRHFYPVSIHNIATFKQVCKMSGADDMMVSNSDRFPEHYVAYGD